MPRRDGDEDDEVPRPDSVLYAGVFAPPGGGIPGGLSSDLNSGLNRGLSRVDGERVIAALDAPFVRDLAWLLTSPNLLSRQAFNGLLADPGDVGVFGPDAPAHLLALLTTLNSAPDDIAHALAAHQERRLGRYAERLLALWLENAKGVTVTALGLPVRDDSRTLGECDALFKTAHANEHWELAVKFYLHIEDEDEKPAASSVPDGDSAYRAPRAPDLSECAAYVGAGLADRLDWKLRRLLEHQMPLSRHAALLALAPGPWNARMFVKGRLFYPIERWRAALPSSPSLLSNADEGASIATPRVTALAIDHSRGWWATLDTWRAWSATVPCRWTALARLDWLASLRVDGARALGASAFVDGLIPRGADLLHPIQVAALTAGSADSPAIEISRGFIVPNDWPIRARRFRNDAAYHQR